MAVITYVKDRLELRGPLAELLAILRALHAAGYARDGDVTISLAPQAPQQQTTAQTSAQPAKIGKIEQIAKRARQELAEPAITPELAGAMLMGNPN